VIPASELSSDRTRRLLVQQTFPTFFVSCPCQRGCLVCAYTGLISKAEAKQAGRRNPASPRRGSGHEK
jgi:hypothetical protein